MSPVCDPTETRHTLLFRGTAITPRAPAKSGVTRYMADTGAISFEPQDKLSLGVAWKHLVKPVLNIIACLTAIPPHLVSIDFSFAISRLPEHF